MLRGSQKLLLTFGLLLSVSGQPSPTEEPPFPDLFGELGQSIHIVSEVYDPQSGYSTREEFIDLSLGKATFIVTRSTGHESYHMDASTQSSYHYYPYECEAFHFPKKPPGLPDDGFWITEKWARPDGADGEPKRMYLTGVAAVWANARDLPKRYRWAEDIYSVSKDMAQTAHHWEVKMGDTKANFYFHSSQTARASNEGMTLELIEIEEKDGKKTTINLLEYVGDIDVSVYNNELQLPLSYGCHLVEVTAERQEILSDIVSYIRSEGANNRLKLEVTATKRGVDGKSATKSSSDTMNLEFLRSSPYGVLMFARNPIQMLRQRNSRLDTKLILDHKFNVKYEIDERQGTCAMSNAGDMFPESETKMEVKFSNGLDLKFDAQIMETLFLDADKYRWTKSTLGPDRVRYVYLTVPTVDLLAKGSRAGRERIVRKYSIRDSDTTNQKIRLESVTIYVLSSSSTSTTKFAPSNIDEIYHFTIFDSSSFYEPSQMARAFDTSQECYLDSENTNGMKYGRDFAWLRLHYSVPDNQLQASSQNGFRSAKSAFYRSMRDAAQIANFRFPRLELLPDESGFTLRFLLLDSPPLHMIFDRSDATALKASDGDRNFFSELAPDLRHCAELCRLHRCSAFSFSANSFSCVLTTKAPVESLAVLARGDAILFLKPTDFKYDEYIGSKLHHFIGQLQRHDLSSVRPPEMPDEFLPGSNALSTLSVAESDKLLMKWLNDVTKYLSDFDGLLGVSLIERDGLVCAPDRFEVEQDPLAEFGLSGRDELQLDDNELPAFHEGLSSYKFDRAAFGGEKSGAPNKDSDTDADADADRRPESRRYVGVDFEQCQLACLDGKCSSFSFCRQRQECAITNLWDLQADGAKYIAPDADCAILQRDFLSKFHKLPGVRAPPPSVKPVEAATNAAECAHKCFIGASDYTCLAFTFCPAANGEGQCHYSASRSLHPSQIGQPSSGSKSSSEQPSAGRCDHYSRSYLADFTRLEYRQLRVGALDQLKGAQVEGKSVDGCAEICATQLMDCTAFQFCYDPEQRDMYGQPAQQVCLMIESPPKEKREDFKVALGSKGGKVLEAGKLFENNPNCHVFSMRKGSSEAELRQLALNALEKDDEKAANSPAGLSLGGGLLLFVCATLVFSAAGMAILVAQHNSHALRSRLDRLRALYGRY